MNMTSKLAIILAGLCVAGSAAADDLMIFPNSDQSKEQQEQDKFSCYSWAKDEAGFDPMAPPEATEPPPQQQAQRGGVGRGLVRGAAIGGIVDGSDGAKTGAAAGALLGGMRRQDQKRQEAAAREQWEAEQQAIYAEKRSRYNRAYAACLEAKDYTVR